MQNHHPVVQDGRCAETMLANPAAKILAPHLFPVMIEGLQRGFRRSRPADVDMIAVDGRRTRREAAADVNAMCLRLVLLHPTLFAVDGTVAEHVAGGVSGIRTQNEHPVTPNDGRGMTDPRQLHLPVVIRLGPFDRNRRRLADTGPIRAAEPCPLLGREVRYKQDGGGQTGKNKFGLRELHSRFGGTSSRAVDSSRS